MNRHCPAHDDSTPSLSVTEKDGKLLYFCHAGCSQSEVLAALQKDGSIPPKHKKRKAPSYVNENDRRARIEVAQAKWDRAIPIEGTLAERYLREHRCIDWRLPSHALGFLKYVQAGLRVPAMIASLRDGDNEVTAVQVTYLDSETGRKADLRTQRQTLGVMGQSAVRLARIGNGTILGLAEGVETALSVMELHNVPTWATLSARRLGSIAIPDQIRSIHIYADNDQPGIDAAQKAAHRYRAAGYEVTIFRPALLGDYNDLLRSDKHG